MAEKKPDLKFCPIMLNTFTHDELMEISQEAILQWDEQEHVNAMFLSMAETSFEIYTDTPYARESGKAIILDCEREGISCLCRQDFLEYFRQHGMKQRPHVQHIYIDE